MTTENFIEMDVAKQELVIRSDQGVIKIANMLENIDAWLASLPTASRIGLDGLPSVIINN